MDRYWVTDYEYEVRVDGNWVLYEDVQKELEKKDKKIKELANLVCSLQEQLGQKNIEIQELQFRTRLGG